MLVGGADSNDPLGSRHLQLEVGEVGDGHELGVPWSSDDCVVGASQTHHFESEGLLLEVGCHVEEDQ